MMMYSNKPIIIQNVISVLQSAAMIKTFYYDGEI